MGVDIVRRALKAPAKQIADNAGQDGAVIVGKLLESTDANFGFNAQTNEFTDLVKSGVIDPTKVVRSALQNAASVAGLSVTTQRSLGRAQRARLRGLWRRLHRRATSISAGSPRQGRCGVCEGIRRRLH